MSIIDNGDNTFTVTGAIESVSELIQQNRSTWYSVYVIDGVEVHVPASQRFLWDDEAGQPLLVESGTVEVTVREYRDHYVPVPPYRSSDAFRRVV